jgi:trehalose 6-phosphate phosphatase
MSPAPGEAPALDALLAPLRDDPASSAVLCDVDGTLAPIVERASDARVPADTADLLGSLADRYALVACVSGRPASEVRDLVGRDDLAYIGNHGYERLLPGDAEPSADPELRGHEDAAARFLESDAVRSQLGAAELRLEDKGPIRALHWRGASDERAAELRARELAARAQEAGLFAHWGRKVLELRPPVEIDKGSAIADLLRAESIAAALYGGDDRTDVDAFRRVREMAASGELRAAACIGIASSEGPPEVTAEADAVVDGPRGFAEVLRMLE